MSEATVYCYVAIRDEDFLLLDWRDLPDEQRRLRRISGFEQSGYRIEPLVLQSALRAVEQERDALRALPDPGPFANCHDCGRAMVWSSARALPSWMCPSCVFDRARTSEERVRALTEELSLSQRMYGEAVTAHVESRSALLREREARTKLPDPAKVLLSDDPLVRRAIRDNYAQACVKYVEQLRAASSSSSSPEIPAASECICPHTACEVHPAPRDHAGVSSPEPTCACGHAKKFHVFHAGDEHYCMVGACPTRCMHFSLASSSGTSEPHPSEHRQLVRDLAEQMQPTGTSEDTPSTSTCNCMSALQGHAFGCPLYEGLVR